LAKDWNIKCLCGLFDECIPGCVNNKGNNMSVKVPQEYADYDFGFTGVDESEIKQDVLQALDEKHQELTEKEQELANKVKMLESIIVPLLNNLMKTSDKAYIYWPNRKEKCQEMLEKVLKTTRG